MSQRLRVLVVDDQPIILEAVRQMLAEAADLEVRLEGDARAAVAVALEFEPTVILLDVNMDSLGGLDVLALVRAEPRLTDVPVVMLSVAEEPETKVEAFRCGANDYVVKLPSALELVARVRYHARACLAAREREAAFRALLESRAALEARNVEIEAQKARLELMNRDLAESAVTDPLTGLRNRRYLRLHLERPHRRRVALPELRERRSGEVSGQTICLLDLDHFKQINDRFGHDVGDVVLVEVAQRLSNCLREDDCLLRWGGEEFLVIAGGHTSGGTVLAQRILDRVGCEPVIAPGGREIPVSCSLGFAPFPWSPPEVAEADAANLDQVLSLADVACYLAKVEGRNRGFGVFPGPELGLLERLPDLGADPTLLRGENGRSVQLHGLLGPRSESQHQELLLP